MPISSVQSKRGGAAMEYIIVSTFAALLSLAAVTFMAKVAKSKLQALSEKLGVDTSQDDFDLDMGLFDAE